MSRLAECSLRWAQLPRIAPHVERGSMDSAPPLSTNSQLSINGSTPHPPASEPYPVHGIPASSGATFGVDLGEQLARDGAEVPKVVEKCAKAIETFGELRPDDPLTELT